MVSWEFRDGVIRRQVHSLFSLCYIPENIPSLKAISLTANAGRASAAGPSSCVSSVPPSSRAKTGAPIPAIIISRAWESSATFLTWPHTRSRWTSQNCPGDLNCSLRTNLIEISADHPGKPP